MIEVELVTRRGAWTRQLADGFTAEWPQWAATLSRDALEEGFVSGAGNALPRIFVAHEEGRALGTVALREWFDAEPMPETPWIRGFYVVPERRGRNIDRMLVRAAEEAARSLGYGMAYSATTRIERLALRRGWSVFRRIEHHGEPMAWMSKTLSRELR